MEIYSIRLPDELNNKLEEIKELMEKQNPGMPIYYSDVFKMAISHLYKAIKNNKKSE